MNTMSSVIVAMALLATGAAAASSSGCGDTMDMVDNWRAVQPTNADTRTVYRTSAATGTCNTALMPSSTSADEAMSETSYPVDPTTASHWSYEDQENWGEYGTNNECFFSPNMLGTYPGESPINVVPTATTVPNTDPVITLSGYDKDRKSLPIFNNGHTVGYSVCPNSFDCGINANFGTWPSTLRGISPSQNDDYFLLQMHWHWGSDDTKGSEHLVCSKPRAAELHLVWLNKNNITSDRHHKESGLLLAVTGIMIEGGATEDNAAFASMIDNVPKKAQLPGNGGTGVSINVKDLLPTDWQTKFYTYPGSLTTPPCSQVVSWFLFENIVKLSDAQLDKLRQSQMPYVGDSDSDSSGGLSGPMVALVAVLCVLAVLGAGAFMYFNGKKPAPNPNNSAIVQKAPTGTGV
mmetsp:Transcript_19189/g.43428  ORF Transcript_19189/g.43428 Transcript_19189/m.43428 type:complete len:406 (+) Transcript_19189:49-1266(+)